MGFSSITVAILGSIFVVLTFPLSLVLCFKIVREYERAVIFRMGKLRSQIPYGPGIFFIIPCFDQYHKIDLRITTFEVLPQEISTSDFTKLTADAILYYKVCNPISNVIQVSDFNNSVQHLAASALRSILSGRQLSEILSGRMELSNKMQRLLEKTTDTWGMQIERVDIKILSLPIQLQQVMTSDLQPITRFHTTSENEIIAQKTLESSEGIAASPAAL